MVAVGTFRDTSVDKRRLPYARTRARPGRSGTASRSSTASTSPSPRRSTGAWTRATSPTPRPRSRWTCGSPSAIWRPSRPWPKSAVRPPAGVRCSSSGAIPAYARLQFALAGINAHIGHDLALAVVDTCRTLDCEPADLEDEFEHVGDILITLEERIREDLMPGPDLLQIADPLTHLLGCVEPGAGAGRERGRRPARCGRCATCPTSPTSSPAAWTRRSVWRAGCCSRRCRTDPATPARHRRIGVRGR